MQVGGFGGQVDFGQRQTAGGLLQVDTATDTGLGAAQQLLEGGAVLNVVVLCEIDQETVADHVEVGTRSLERDGLGSIEQFVVTHQLGFAEALDLVTRGKAVKNHLVEADQPAVAVVVALLRQLGATDKRLLKVFATGTGDQINLGQETTARDIDFIDRSLKVVLLGNHLWIIQHCFLGNFSQRRKLLFGVRRQGICCHAEHRKGRNDQY